MDTEEGSNSRQSLKRSITDVRTEMGEETADEILDQLAAITEDIIIEYLNENINRLIKEYFNEVMIANDIVKKNKVLS